MPPKWLHESVAFVCVASMGIDILFPIVGAPSPFLSLHSARRPPLPIQPLFLRPIHPPSRFASLSLFLPLSLFFGQHSAFFSIIILFRIQSIISISIVLRYFHLASRFERDGTRAMAREMNEEGDTRWTEGGGRGRSFDDGAKGVSVGWLFQLARFPWPPSRGSPSSSRTRTFLV